jgi:hypothetical protein
MGRGVGDSSGAVAPSWAPGQAPGTFPTRRLCLWAGADPHAPAPNPNIRVTVSPSSREDEDLFVGWSAVEEAATAGHLEILKRLGPDPGRDDFDHLYQFATSESIIAYLATIQLPKDLTSALSWHLRWMVDPFPLSAGSGPGAVEKLLTCGVRWEETDPKELVQVRGSLVKAREYELRSIFRHLKRPEVCAPETLQELMRTPKMRERLLAFGLLKKPISQRDRRHVQVRGGPASRVGPSLDQPVGTDGRLPRIDEFPGELGPPLGPRTGFMSTTLDPPTTLRHSGEREERPFWIRVESQQVRAPAAQQRLDVPRRAVSPSDPDHLRRVAEDEASLVELRVFGHDDVAVPGRVGPHGFVRSTRQPDVANVR